MHGRGHEWQRSGAWHAWQGAWEGMCGGENLVGCVWQHGDGGGCVWQGGVHAMHTPQQILQDTVNERAVCILLECILVIIQMTKVVQFLCTLYVLFYENLSSCVFAVESNVISKH